MKQYKAEREWSDLDKSEKVALCVGVVLWAMLAFGIYNDTKNINTQTNAKESVYKMSTVPTDAVLFNNYQQSR